MAEGIKIPGPIGWLNTGGVSSTTLVSIIMICIAIGLNFVMVQYIANSYTKMNIAPTRLISSHLPHNMHKIINSRDPETV
jgi:hypothetical protein